MVVIGVGDDDKGRGPLPASRQRTARKAAASSWGWRHHGYGGRRIGFLVIL